MYDRALTEIEIKGLAEPPYLTTMDDLSGILIKYTRDLGSKDNLKTGLDEEIQHFIYYNGTEYYAKEVLSYLRRIDISLNQIVSDISDLSQNVNVRLDDLSGSLLQTIDDLSQNVNIRLEDLSKTMIESIVPVVTDVSLNKGTIEINFTKDISNESTYDANNFMVRYNDVTSNYNNVSIVNGNVILKNLTEIGSGTALLTGLNSNYHSNQSYSSSTEQTSSSSTASKAFDGQITGQDSNTWKSSNNTYSGASSLVQLYFEDFEDNSYQGSETTADIVDVSGYKGTITKALHTEIDNTKKWRQTDISNVKNISFWVYFNNRPGGYGTSMLTIHDPSSNGDYNYVALWMGIAKPNNGLMISKEGSLSSKTYSYYINGVENSTLDISNGRWNHISFNIQEGISGSIHWMHSYPVFQDDEIMYMDTYLDEVRFFNEELTQQQISDLSNGVFDISPGKYLGSQTTQGYSGEWIQVDTGDNSITSVSSFTIKPQQNSTESIIKTHPAEFKMFASNNSTSWDEIHYVTDLSEDTWYSNNTFNNYTISLSTPQEYQYWRLAVGRTIEGTQVSIGEIDLNGSIIVNNVSNFIDVNKLEIAYRKNSDKTKNLVDLIGGGQIDEFIYKGLGLTNINKEIFTDLSDVSLNSIIEGQFVKFDGNHFVPTNDISDISQNLADEIDRAISKEANIDGAIATINNQLTTLLTDAPTTLDTLKEIADVLGDPTDPSGGIGNILTKLQDISDDIIALSNQSANSLGDLSGQTTASINNLRNELNNNINDLSTNVFDRIQVSETKLTFFEMMTQQPHAFSVSGDVISTAADITLNWTYDDILANASDTILAKLAFQNTIKQKNLPFIDNIIIEISGNINTGNSSYDNNSNTWLTYTRGIWPKTFTNTEDYNQSTYKTLTINKVSQEQANSDSINNILSKTDAFDIRIYGTNYAENYPTIHERSLYFNNISFVTAFHAVYSTIFI